MDLEWYTTEECKRSGESCEGEVITMQFVFVICVDGQIFRTIIIQLVDRVAAENTLNLGRIYGVDIQQDIKKIYELFNVQFCNGRIQDVVSVPTPSFLCFSKQIGTERLTATLPSCLGDTTVFPDVSKMCCTNLAVTGR